MKHEYQIYIEFLPESSFSSYCFSFCASIPNIVHNSLDILT